MKLNILQPAEVLYVHTFEGNIEDNAGTQQISQVSKRAENPRQKRHQNSSRR